VSTATPIPPASARGGRPVLITAETYFRMIEIGAIPDARHVELWEGQLVEKMGKNQPHIVAQGLCMDALIAARLAGWHVVVEGSLRLSPLRVPEPDLIVVRGARNDYAGRPPTPADVALVVEVADSSVPKDLGRMRAAYAAGGVPLYWVLDLRTRRVETHAEPAGDDAPAYLQIRSYGPDEAVPLVLDASPVAELPVSAVLPSVERS
jgi:Uma2 family endonuclease